MYRYSIWPEINEKLFYQLCAEIEEKVPSLTKEELLVNEDESFIQVYEHPDGKIVVRDDVEVDALYIDSDLDLEQYLGRKLDWREAANGK